MASCVRKVPVYNSSKLNEKDWLTGQYLVVIRTKFFKYLFYNVLQNISKTIRVR